MDSKLTDAKRMRDPVDVVNDTERLLTGLKSLQYPVLFFANPVISLSVVEVKLAFTFLQERQVQFFDRPHFVIRHGECSFDGRW